MRTGRERLTEWIGDLLFDVSGMPEDEYQDHIAAYQSRAKPWVDNIMDDINKGIIGPEKGE